MKQSDIKTTAVFFFLIFISFAVSYFYEGLMTLPAEGDSLAYHIPIARSVLDGTILHPRFYLGYYPANAELILALFMLFHIPLNLFNVFGWVLLFAVLRKLGVAYGLTGYFSVIFSGSIVMVHSMIRWLTAQIIDIWLAVFFAINMLILSKFRGTKLQYFIFGVVAGLLIGIKYSGPFYVLLLSVIYRDRLLKTLTIGKTVLWFIPVSILGLSWYVRNMFLTGNPIYPQPLFGLPGMPGWDIFAVQVWEATLKYPGMMVNAYIAEFMFWLLCIAALIAYYFLSLRKTKYSSQKITTVIFIGIVCFFIYELLPTNNEYNIMVSSIRYSYPAFISLMLAVFLTLQKIRKELYIIIFSFMNILFLPSLSYRPKLILPAIVLVYFLFRKYPKRFFSETHEE